MKIVFLGNQDNNAYRLCNWMRACGYDATLYMMRQDRSPRSQPEAIDASLSGDDGPVYPDWVQWYDDTSYASYLRGSRVARQVGQSADVVVTMGATGLLAANQIRRTPIVHMCLGSEVIEFPYLLTRWRASPAWRTVAWLCRRGLKRIDRLVIGFRHMLPAVAHFRLQNKTCFWGFPEDAERNAGRSDPGLAAQLERDFSEVDRVFLWLSRLNFLDPGNVNYKAAHVFAQALAEVVRSGDLPRRFKVVIGQHGSDAEAYRSMITDLGLDAVVTYVPHLPYYQLLAYLRQPKTVVFDNLAPQWGGLSGIAREALSVGAAIVKAPDEEMIELTYGPGCPILPASNVAACRDAMVRLLAMDDAALAELRAAHARWAAEYLHYPRNVRRFADILKEVVVVHSADRP